MDKTKHTKECKWSVKKIKKTAKWYKFMGIKHCPNCGVEVEVTDEEV